MSVESASLYSGVDSQSILSWNIQRGQGGIDNIVDTLEEAAERHDLSYILLQEAASKDGKDPEEGLAIVRDAFLTRFPTWEVESVVDKEAPVNEAILTAWKPENVEHIHSTPIILPQPAGKPNFFQRRFTPPRELWPQLRALMTTFKDAGDRRIRITNAHLDSFGGHETRLAQAKVIYDARMAAGEVDIDIIGGDFNSLGLEAVTPSKVRREREQLYSAMLGDSEVIDLTPGVSYTHNLFDLDYDFPDPLVARLAGSFKNRVGNIRQRLDHLVAKGAYPIKAGVEKVAHSDHLPLFVTFGLGMRQVEEE